MLSRTCEPPADDPKLEAKVYREMDHGDVNRRFVTDLFRSGPVGPRVIDLGCGPALIPILLCEHAEQITCDDVESDDHSELVVMGVDNCAEMLELARFEIEFAGRLRQIQLQRIDLSDDESLDAELADTVICNTVLHHLDDPAAALRLAIRALQPAGRLFIRDLVRPETETEVERLVALHGGAVEENASGVSPSQLLRQSFYASLTLAEIRGLVSDLGIDADCVNMTSDRHWTLDCRRPERS
ncbi:class I SAM-dependent methyltransferase [Allorhodopirellula heiligendammensis]|uniref:Ubiquinone biosynthesis O-methyltransferase n=1 Tax=Allorhodopirellula heiligendammensis TaxID=2714739 RepID=A0A5C6BYK9_9BACT|nr:class I SAM-dependent methyltransferase [Allorhodopirellula heiligendammensis]TWU16922.1 Ubiquinone biosynthesis O-methyltransferase [Allorhodopirellula heiligendammensis]